MDGDPGDIQGVAFIPLERSPDERGTIYHMLRRTDPHFREFGEIYFTSIYRDVIKGWHRHRLVTLNYACLWGGVKLGVYGRREGSPTRGTLSERFLGPDDYSLAIVPPGIWTGLKGMAAVASGANGPTQPHAPTLTERLDPFAPEIDYDWSIRHR